MDKNDLLNKSDEDFLNEMPSYAEEPADTIPVEEEPKPTEVEDTSTEETPTEESADTSDEEEVLVEEEEPKEEEEQEVEQPGIEDEKFDYQAAYEKITAPFKANGKEITLRSPEEVIQMMQMGANYTRKMQSIAPHRKVLMMLQNNDLLDEEKLSLLIDLNKKDPAAIQKFLKDAGVDPLEIDVNADSTYTPGNHQVTENEVLLTSILEDLTSTPEGRETVQLISDEWDQASKDALLSDPEVLTVIHEQKQNGVYNTITSEIERRLVLGSLSANLPFLEAYKAVGTELAQAGGSTTVATPTPAPVARTVPGSSKATNTDKVQATQPARSVGKGKTKIDPLALSDEDYLKFMQTNV